ncbi:MAG: hypothetical protein HY359_17520 [Candidatus Rokubacteria bacterium]|nr:hypothetical protein [Candidatus Rokubacteria bacterium]
MARRSTLPAIPPGSPRPIVRRDAGPPDPPLAPGHVERWRSAPLPIDPWTVLRLARYRRRDEVAPAIGETARRMTARAEELVEPAAWLVVARVAEAGPQGARLADGPAFAGRAVGRLLAGCPLAVAFALTLGPHLEGEVGTLAGRRELLEAFLLDTAGWAAIEAAVRALRLDLRARAGGAGWRITHRLAPGYRDWPIEEQRALLGVVDAAGPAVRLSEHGVLVPFKSITGLFGLAPAPET